MRNLTRELWQDIENGDSKIKQGVYKCLNKDNFSLMIDSDVFWFEKTWSGAKIPNYVYNWIIKWGKKKGLKYLYN